MDPYTLLDRLRRIAARLEEGFFTFDDSFQESFAGSIDRYEAKAKITNLFDLCFYPLFYAGSAVLWIGEKLAKTRVILAVRRWNDARFERSMQPVYEASRRERESIERWNQARDARLADEARRAQAVAAPTLVVIDPDPVVAAAEAEKHAQHLRDVAERDWYARNIRLMEPQYWEGRLDDPARWWNPDFPG